MEEVGKEGPILSIFLSQFDADIGPVIVCQYPPNDVIKKDLFDTISVYVIPKPEVQKKVIITVSAFGYKITGYPNIIENSKYPRNAFIFNLCFVCGSNSRTAHYEPIVKKLSEYLEDLELEYNFLSNKENDVHFPGILKKILEDMNNDGKCTINIIPKAVLSSERRMSISRPLERRFSLTSEKKQHVECSSKPHRKSIDSQEQNGKFFSMDVDNPLVSVLHLKRVIGLQSEPVQVQDQHVPILTSIPTENRIGQYWELTTQQILPYIDGLSHVAKIAAESDVNVNLVKACVQNLIYYGFVKIIPIFQYSNMYTTLPDLHSLYKSKEVQDECIKAVCITPSRTPTVSSLIQIYSSLTYGLSVRDLCQRFHMQDLHIDERKLIQFGLMQNFIRRLHHYPVFASEEYLLSSDVVGSLHKMCNGLHSIDEICCKFGMAYKDVIDRLERDSNIVIILK